MNWVDIDGPPSRFNACKVGWDVGEITDSGSDVLMILAERQPRDGEEHGDQERSLFLPVCETTADFLQELADAVRAKLREPDMAVRE